MHFLAWILLRISPLTIQWRSRKKILFTCIVLYVLIFWADSTPKIWKKPSVTMVLKQLLPHLHQREMLNEILEVSSAIIQFMLGSGHIDFQLSPLCVLLYYAVSMMSVWGKLWSVYTVSCYIQAVRELYFIVWSFLLPLSVLSPHLKPAENAAKQRLLQRTH